MKNDMEHFAEAFNEHVWLGGARNSKEVTSFIEDVIQANTDLAARDANIGSFWTQYVKPQREK